jgi:hypothetical protein
MRRRFLRHAAVTAACCALLVGCGNGDAWDGRISTLPNGAMLVENPAEGVWRDDAAWRVEEDLRIGSQDGDGPDVFSVVFAYDVDDDGNIYVFDALSRELRVFGDDGAFVREFGRKGGGPGEFEGVIGVRAPEPGTVWLVDMQNSRYTVLRGDSVASFPRPAGMYRPPWIGGFTADGIFHDLSAIRDGEVFVRVSRDGTVRDTVRLPYPELNLPRRGSNTFELPFGPRHLRAFDESGYIWAATTHDYRLHRISLAGDTVLVVTHPQQPLALTQQQRDSVADYARMLEQEVRVSFSADMLPRTAPVLDWLAVDDAGHIWAGLAGEPDAPTQADVFDGDGRYLGRVVLPVAGLPALPPRFRDGRLYLVGHDALGTPIVFRGRVRRGAQ